MKFLVPATAAFLAVAAPALAEDCKLPVLAASVDLASTGDGRVLAPVMIDGTPRNLLVATAGNTTLTTKTTEALALHPVQQALRVLDSNGYASDRYVRIRDLGFGGLRAARLTILLTPDPNAGIDPAFDGVLGPDAMNHYDVEMDFAAHKLNYFSQDHCPGYVVYWPAPAGTIIPFVLRGRVSDSFRHGEIVQHLAGLTDDEVGNEFYTDLELASGSGIAGIDVQTHVMLDGKEFRANIDTSLPYSTLNTNAARAAFDVDADSPGSAPTASLLESAQKPGGETVTVYGSHSFEHTFRTLSLGGVTVVNPHFLVRPDLTGKHDPNNRPVLGSHANYEDDNVEPDVSIGMDMLQKLHLYFAFQERKLYITAAGPQQNAAAQ